MKVIAEGTGPGGGLPVPDCPCALCRRMRRDGRSRAPAQLRIEADDAATDHRAVVLRLGDDPAITGGVLWLPAANRLGALGAPASIGDATPGSIRLAVIGPDATGDLVAAGHVLATLRTYGLLADDAECWLIAAQHRGAPPARRDLLLQAWGMTQPEDGQIWAGSPGVRMPADQPDQHPVGRVLVLGGSASGKSQLAEDLLAAWPEVTYVATGPRAAPEQDADWAARVQRHQERRPATWKTLETTDPASILGRHQQPLLLDSIGSWLAGDLDRRGAWDDAGGWRAGFEQAAAALITAWGSRPGPVVAVTDEVGWGVVPPTAAGRLFRDLLGRVNQGFADASDQVLVVVAGQVLTRAGDGP